MLADFRILVVEDDSSVAAVCKDTLEELGAIVTVAATIRDGILIANTLPLDAILCDVALPDGSVDDLRESLQSHPENSAVWLFVMSGYDLRRRYTTDDIGGYLQKPFHIDELEKAITNALARHKGLA